eukprot:jgi/Astpho2/5114/Aster-06326
MAVAQPIGGSAEAAVRLEEGTSAATENKAEHLETGSSSPSSSPKSTKQEVAQSNGKPQKQNTKENRPDVLGPLTLDQRQAVVLTALRTQEQDAEILLDNMKQRFSRVDMQVPAVEVRFEGLHIDTEVYAETGRNLPTILNAYRAVLEYAFLKVGLLRPRKVKMTILNNITSVLKPGRATLLLGPPAAGKSTLLKALSGKLAPHGLKIDGKVTYNGHTFNDFLAQRTAAYVEQEDQHMPELTVRETLDFSARMQGVGARGTEYNEICKREKDEGIEPDWDVDDMMKAQTLEGAQHSVNTEYVVKMLGLDICAETVVGNAMLRGISGGQKKRVTSGEMLVGPKRVLFMDEISTGLDSSTTYSICKWLRDTAHSLHYTMLIALLQPAPETFDLFDDILLLSEGYLVYHGPREQIMDFFESLGFACPERKGIADFLQEVTSRRDQEQYFMGPAGQWHYISVQSFADHFRKFKVGRETLEELAATPPPPQELPPKGKGTNSDTLVSKPYALGPWEMCKACMEREVTLVKRNAFLYIFRFFLLTLIAIVVATLFLRTNLQPNSLAAAQQYFSVVFFSLIMLMFDGFAEMTFTCLRLAGWYKQRDNNFYPAWAYVFPTTLLRLPYSIGAAFLWAAIVYYPTGCAPEASRFFTFVLLLALVHSMGIAMFRTIGALARNETVASTGGSFLFLVLLLLGGFLLAKQDMNPWTVWVFWANPIMYIQRAIAINEFAAPRWKNLYIGGESVSASILGGRGVPQDEYWIWIGVAAMVFFNILFNITAWLCHAYLNPLESPSVTLRPTEEEEEAKAENAKGIEKGGVQQNGLQNGQDGAANQKALGNGDGTPHTNGNGMVLPFNPLDLTFHHLNYYVDLPKEVSTDPEKLGPRAADVGGKKMLQLLNDVSGAFRPGILTALVGSSGAGKTTLMDVLAGRKTSESPMQSVTGNGVERAGQITGDVRVSGHPKVQATFARVMGYCEQTDIHSPFITVHESLIFSARLRFSTDVDRATVNAFVNEVEELVELTPLSNALVGKPGLTGLSVEARKRLTIAVELVANPSIVFMDEPTSGLDARAAAIVMRTVRNTVNTGRTVVCTIHQPSIDIFEAFDDLLLLKSGGYVTYHGHLGKQSRRLIEYFEAIPGVPRLQAGLNPATWMLQVSTPGMEANIGVDFAKKYRESKLYLRNEELIKKLQVPAEGSQPLQFSSKYPQGYLTQFYMVFWKFWQSYWRNPAYNSTRFLFGAVLGLLMGAILWKVNHKRTNSQDLGNILGALYIAMLFLGIIGSMTVQPVAATERAVMYRERAAGMYDELPFALAQCFIEIPYTLGQDILFSACAYWMMGFDADAGKFFWFVFVVWMTLLLMTFYGIMGVYVTPDLAIASVLSSFFYGFWNLFTGFLVPVTQMVPWWKWFFYINPLSWTLYGIIVTQLGDQENLISTGVGQPVMTIKQYLNQNYDYQLSFIGPIVGIMFGFIIFFAGLAIVCLKFVNFQKR